MIKATFESLHPIDDNSFIIRRFTEKAFSAPYHFHPELELTLIIKGEGKRYVGSNMSAYKEGDLVLLGSNLPHCWKSENIKKGKSNAASLVIQFNDNFLGDHFFSKIEMVQIAQMLETSKYGIQFLSPLAPHIGNQLLSLQKETDHFKKLIRFLEILQQLATTKNYVLLDKQQKAFTQSESEKKRINEVTAYIVENFKTGIILDKAAAIAQMTPTAFCKYYKRMTRKTFISTVMDYRINYAAQQLVQTDKPISDIGYASGFGDMSHFYKSFRSQKKLSPLKYRKKFMQDVA